MNFGGDHSAPGHGKISPRCVPEGASDEKNTGSRQHIACMHSDSANFGKICVPCIRKAPQSAVGECTARTSCRQGALSPSEALRSCTAHESCRPPVALPLSTGSCPAAASRDRLSTAWPLRRDACPSAPPIPATCQCLPLAAPITARDKPPMGFGGDHPAHGLQFGQAPRDCRLHHLGVRPTTECCAELGLDSKTVNKWAQNRRRRPQARPVLRQRCQKRPSKGRVPLDGTIGAPSGTPIPHTLPLRKNEAAKPGKNFAKRVIFTPRTRFRRLSGEISPKCMRNWPVDAKNFAKRIQNGLKAAAEEHVSSKSRPIGAEILFGE